MMRQKVAKISKSSFALACRYYSLFRAYAIYACMLVLMYIPYLCTYILFIFQEDYFVIVGSNQRTQASLA